MLSWLIPGSVIIKIPKNPIPLPKESLIELQEHHIPPVISREFYFSDKRKNWLKRFEN